MTGPDRAGVQAIVEAFDAAWRRPHPRAWDEILSPDYDFTQPFLVTGRGVERWREEAARLLWMLPDLTGRVVGWAARGETLFIELACTATVGRGTARFSLVDRIRLDEGGRLSRRTTFLDPFPMIGVIARSPRLWRRWWYSGLGPLAARRRVLRSRPWDHAPAGGPGPRPGGPLSRRPGRTPARRPWPSAPDARTP